MFLLHLWSYRHQTLYDGTLAQNLSKTSKILMTSSLSRVYDVIDIIRYCSRSKFEILCRSSNLAAILHISQCCSALISYNLT